eukprot:2470330-Pyramimonas_sp.AAC.1
MPFLNAPYAKCVTCPICPMPFLSAQYDPYSRILCVLECPICFTRSGWAMSCTFWARGDTSGDAQGHMLLACATARPRMNDRPRGVEI